MPDGASLNLFWPFKVLPECGKAAVLVDGMETGNAMGKANGGMFSNKPVLTRFSHDKGVTNLEGNVQEQLNNLKDLT